MDADASIASRIVNFLRGIGIEVDEATVPDDAFLPGIRIVAGRLLVDHTRLRWPGDLLHEAGHIATMPAHRRATLHDALDDASAHDDVAFAGEAEATAWAWAARVHLGLPPDVLFHAGGYRGTSARLIATYSLGVYPGAHGLAQAGMTCVGAAATAAGVPPYPHMQRWLRA